MTTITTADLDEMASFIDERINPPDEPGAHCDGTPRFAREYLEVIGEAEALEEYLEAANARCDCFVMMQTCVDDPAMACACCGTIRTSCADHHEAVH